MGNKHCSSFFPQRIDLFSLVVTVASVNYGEGFSLFDQIWRQQ
jgi:hypothetical protein